MEAILISLNPAEARRIKAETQKVNSHQTYKKADFKTLIQQCLDILESNEERSLLVNLLEKQKRRGARD
ncbi:MAG: hypothetical protein B6D53_02660 [Candidatus Omnitrophica bacterium 4484_49]|nr:hypothetical protein [Candidatus Omnitrophota bacterium]OQX83351.1 MAG: hypothetical protein B6D53_02660 [Candidatus Omnitrophica bacterium 4484_49]